MERGRPALLVVAIAALVAVIALGWGRLPTTPHPARPPDRPVRPVATTTGARITDGAVAPAPPDPAAEEPVDPDLARRQFDAAVHVARALEADADPALLSTVCRDGGRSCLHRAPLRGEWTVDDVRAAIAALPGPDRPTAGAMSVEPRPLGGTVVSYELRLEE